MATVPRVANTSVELRPLGTPYQSAAGATPEAFGAGNARALIEGGQRLGQAANQIGELALRIKADDDEREAKDADIAFRQRKLGILRGDGTTENPGFFGTLGQTAIDGYGTSRKALEQSQEEIAKGMKSDRARRLFLESAQRQVVDADEQMIGHVTRQRTAAQDATATSRIESAVSEAALMFTDPKVLAKSIGIVEAEAAGIAQRNGFGKEAAERTVVEARTKVVKGAIVAAIDAQDDRTAQSLFARYGSAIDGREASALGKVINEKAVLTAAQTAADQYFKMVNPNDPTTITKALDKARQDLEGKQEAAVVAELNNRVSELFRVQDQAMQLTRFREANEDRAEARARAARAEKQRDERNAIAREKLEITKRLAEIREEQAKAKTERDARVEAARREREEAQRQARELRAQEARAREERREAREQERLANEARKAEERVAAAERRERDEERKDERLRIALDREQRELQDREVKAADRERNLLREQTRDAERADAAQQRQTAIEVAETLARQGGTYEQQLRAAQEVAQGSMLLQVETILRTRAADAARIKEQTDRANAEQALAYIEEGTPVDKIPTELWNSLPASKRAQLRDRANKLARGEAVETDQAAFETYTSMTADELRGVDLSVAADELAKPEFNIVRNRVVAARDGKFDPNVTNDSQAITKALDAVGIPKGKGKDDDRGRLWQAINSEVQARREANPGGRLSSEDRDDAIKKAIDQYVLSGPRITLPLIGGVGKSVKENEDAIAAQVGRSSAARAALQLRPQTSAVAATLGEGPLSPAEELRVQETTFASIPPQTRRNIIAILREEGIRSPSNLQIRTAYILGLRAAAPQGE